MPKVSVIIVNFNTVTVLRDCLLNLKDKYSNLEVIVVDNASVDGSAALVESQFSWVKLIKNDKNYGLSVASNKGLQMATGDYLLYMGTDAFPEQNTIEGMVSYMEKNPKVGIATCKLVMRDGNLDMDAHRGFPTLWTSITYFTKLSKIFPKSKLFNRYFQGWQNLDVPHEIDLCISHFMLIRRSVFKDLVSWNEEFFVFGEDVDLCYRAKRAGWKIMYLPQWTALHYKGTGIGIRKTSSDISPASEETKKRMMYERSRARKLFYEKYFLKGYPKVLVRLVTFSIDVLAKLKK